MPTDREFIRLANKGDLGSTGAVNVEDACNKLHQRTVTYSAALDVAGTSVVVGIMTTKIPIRIISAKILPSLTITANANGTIFTLEHDDGVGGADTVVGTFSTVSTTITAQVPASLALTATAVEIPANRQVLFKNTKQVSGVITGPFQFEVTYQEI